MAVKVELGSGWKKISPEHISIDRKYHPRVDIVKDLEDADLPFKTNSVDEVYAYHVLEHITNYIPLVEEIWRILKPSGQLVVKTPNYKHENAYTDPTHVRTFTPKSFNYFDKSKVLYKESGWLLSIARFSVDNVIETDMEITYELTAQKKKILLVGPPASIHIKRWHDYFSYWGNDVSVAGRSLKGLAKISLATEGLEKDQQIEIMPEVMEKYIDGFDVIHAHFATVYGHVLEAASDGMRKILSIWGEDLLEETKNSKKENILKRGLTKAECVTTTSRYVADYLSKVYGFDESRIWSFPWGYKKNVFFEKNIDPSKLIEFGVPESGKIIASVRACKPQNNIHKIIEGFEKSNVEAYLLILTGDISDTEYTNRLMEATKGNERIRFLRTLREEELALLYNRVNATITIPFVDNLSTTLLESLACGTPVICSDIETYKERITEGKNGLLVNPENVDELTVAIQKSVDYKFKLKAKKLAKKSVEHDSWEENARNMLYAYDAF